MQYGALHNPSPINGDNLAVKLEARFRRLWMRLVLTGVQADAEKVWGELTERYNEGHRRYHTLRHVSHCLRQFDAARSLIDDADAVELAIWFHDVVHNPGSEDNEQLSALLFQRTAQDRLEPGFVARVSSLILATTHHGAPRNREEEFVRDIDLAGIGSPWQRFLSDSKDLRAEQVEIPDRLFYAGKLCFFEELMVRRSVYFTEFFQVRFEAAARSNIGRYIARLGTSPRDGG